MLIIRSDRWQIKSTPQQRLHLERTQKLYRSYVKALIGVVYTHWAEISSASSALTAVERLTHKTKQNSNPKYSYFNKRFHRFPSYLRRAAINAAIGQVSSFATRYHQWQGGIRSRRDALPPMLNADTNLHVVLYLGQCIRFYDNFVEIKVNSGKEWVWEKFSIIKQRQRHLIPTNEALSPNLIMNRKGVFLSIPFTVQTPELELGEVVCGVDLGINTTATASIVISNGTVTARRFFNDCAADQARRDKRLQQIRRAARLTMGKTGKLCKGFCKTIYRKARHINRQIAQIVSRQLVNWAKANGANIIVFENLKGWRPKGGKKGSNLRQRFHNWLHRKLVQLVEEKLAEMGGKVVFVNPRGTSSWAFDGSGEVKRDSKNYSLATFALGKRYSADLSASYNIAARYWANKLKLPCRNGRESDSGRSSRSELRMPVCLSSLWSQKPRLQSVKI